jgi:hypothetical protein
MMMMMIIVIYMMSAICCFPFLLSVTANRPDIIINNNKEKTSTLIDVAIPADRNVVQKGAGKELEYKSLCIEIQRMWNLK